MRREFLQVAAPALLLLQFVTGAYLSHLRAAVVAPAAGQIDWFWFAIVVASGVGFSVLGWWISRPYRIPS